MVSFSTRLRIHRNSLKKLPRHRTRVGTRAYHHGWAAYHHRWATVCVYERTSNANVYSMHALYVSTKPVRCPTNLYAVSCSQSDSVDGFSKFSRALAPPTVLPIKTIQGHCSGVLGHDLGAFMLMSLSCTWSLSPPKFGTQVVITAENGPPEKLTILDSFGRSARSVAL